MGNQTKTKKVNPLLTFVLQGFAKALRPPTPGQVRAYLKEEQGKLVDYTTARSLAGMAKRRLGKGQTIDAIPVEEEHLAGRMRRTATYGR